MLASEVLPSPGGPAKSRWSALWWRARAEPRTTLEVSDEVALADEVLQRQRSQRDLGAPLVLVGAGSDDVLAQLLQVEFALLTAASTSCRAVRRAADSSSGSVTSRRASRTSWVV